MYEMLVYSCWAVLTVSVMRLIFLTVLKISLNGNVRFRWLGGRLNDDDVILRWTMYICFVSVSMYHLRLTYIWLYFMKQDYACFVYTCLLKTQYASAHVHLGFLGWQRAQMKCRIVYNLASTLVSFRISCLVCM